MKGLRPRSVSFSPQLAEPKATVAARHPGGDGCARAFALVVAGGLLLAACAPNAPQDALQPLGEVAREQHALFRWVFWIAAVIFFVVEGLLVYAIFRFRQRSDRDAPVQRHGHTTLEVVWTLIPAGILAVVAVATVGLIFEQARQPRNALEVTVVGHQWWWEYRYPGLGPGGEDLVTANELHIPVGRPVLLTLKGADVIHSFWVPKLAGKQDVIPGRENKMTIKADEPGLYLGQCAEYCGLSHANMRLRVIADAPQDFQAWLAGQRSPAREPSDPLALEGKRLVETGRFAGGNQCSGCHTIAGTSAQGKIGPDLTHLASRETIAGATLKNPDDLEKWLRDPPAMKPMQPEQGIGMPNLRLSEDQIRALVAYLRTLE